MIFKKLIRSLRISEFHENFESFVFIFVFAAFSNQRKDLSDFNLSTSLCFHSRKKFAAATSEVRKEVLSELPEALEDPFGDVVPIPTEVSSAGGSGTDRQVCSITFSHSVSW